MWAGYTGAGRGALLLTGSTVVGSSTDPASAAVIIDDGLDAQASDDVVWDNGPTQLDTLGTGTLAVSYSDVQGGATGTGVLDADPGFTVVATGQLDSLNWNPLAGLATLTDAQGDFTGVSVRHYLQPTSGDARLYPIVGTDATHVTVALDLGDGRNNDLVTWATAGDTYRILSFDLGAGSPCIDAGIDAAGLTTDLRGNSRLKTTVAPTGPGPVQYPDMGAFERQP
jgi:hypothetical protein